MRTRTVTNQRRLRFTVRHVGRRARCCLLMLLVMATNVSAAEPGEPNYFLVTYAPGASWNEAISYEDQPGLKQHHQYLQKLHINDLLVMGGPVTDLNEEYLSIIVLRTGSLEEAQTIASQDPGVQTRMINASVVPWNVTMSSMRFVRRRAKAPVEAPDQSFTIKRIDPESRLNIEDPTP